MRTTPATADTAPMTTHDRSAVMKLRGAHDRLSPWAIQIRPLPRSRTPSTERNMRIARIVPFNYLFLDSSTKDGRYLLAMSSQYGGRCDDVNDVASRPAMTRHAVTGAFGFSGRHIATRLVADGDEVITLTNHPYRPRALAGRVEVAPLAFGDSTALARSLRGVDTLFNTYWVRFEQAGTDHASAVRNSRALFDAARAAGVRRIVHISIANPDPLSRLPYYRGKAEVEAALIESRMGYAILRPAMLFGDEPILVNSIAWLLRRLPIFGIPGDGTYGISPIHVKDLADLAVEAGRGGENVVLYAAGPETFPFTELVMRIRAAVGSRALIVHLPPTLALLAARMIGPFAHDVLLTRDEVDGLTADLLRIHQPPLGTTRFSEWLTQAAPWLGRTYLSEVGRR